MFLSDEEKQTLQKTSTKQMMLRKIIISGSNFFFLEKLIFGALSMVE